MRTVRFFLPWVAILIAAAAMAGCGSVPSTYLQSISISPNSASGSSQFVATGIRINGAKVTPVSAMWWNTQPWTNNPTPAPAFTIDSNGKATCVLGIPESGTFPVWATVPVNPNSPASQMTVRTPQVGAMATITCP